MYEYNKSVKSSISDELINTYVLRPIAGAFVRVLFRTTVSPNQVTIASIVVGLFAALVYLKGNPAAIACAGVLVTTKDVLDSVDGQLARAKQEYSRAGRFLDSIGDFVVDCAVFAAIGWVLSQKDGGALYAILALAGLVGMTFRVSYHVFYQTSFLHLKQEYQNNRVTEEVREEDCRSGAATLALQKLFQVIYGCQDRMVLRMDRWCMAEERSTEFGEKWYSDGTGLRLSGFLGMGTELFLLTVCSLFNRLELYLYMNVVLMNGLLLLSLFYRKAILLRRLLSTTGEAQN